MPTHAIIDNPFGDTQVAVYQRKTILTDAQIKTLPTTPVELVPAPGAGKMLRAIGATCLFKLTGAGYTNLTGATLQLITPASNWLSSVLRTVNTLSIVNTSVSGILCPYFEIDTVPFSEGDGDLVDLENTPILIGDVYNSVTDYTGGDPANTLEITIFYSIVDL